MTTDVARARAVVRSAGLDRLRGLAIVLMVADHAAIWTPHAQLLRLTLGRAAVPIFFILAGHLAGRVRWRHARIAALGLALPLAFPWLDWPNVLTWYAAGVVLLAGLRRARLSPAWLIAVAATAQANGWTWHPGTSYDPLALVALMALGALLPRQAFAPVDRLPARLEVLGRHPIACYVGQAAALSALVWTVRGA